MVTPAGRFKGENAKTQGREITGIYKRDTGELYPVDEGALLWGVTPMVFRLPVVLSKKRAVDPGSLGVSHLISR